MLFVKAPREMQFRSPMCWTYGVVLDIRATLTWWGRTGHSIHHTSDRGRPNASLSRELVRERQGKRTQMTIGLIFCSYLLWEIKYGTYLCLFPPLPTISIFWSQFCVPPARFISDRCWSVDRFTLPEVRSQITDLPIWVFSPQTLTDFHADWCRIVG